MVQKIASPPSRFRAGRFVAAAVVVVLLSACPPMNPLRVRVKPPVKPERTAAAPVFERGPGKALAAAGVEPAPVLLPGEEALDLIARELFYRGVRPFERGVEVEGLHLPGRGSRVDAFDRELGVAVVYVTAGSGDDAGPAREYDFLAEARALARAADGQPARIYVAVFYDPLADPVAEELGGLRYDCADPAYGGDRLQCVSEYYAREREVFDRWRGRGPEVRAASRELLSSQVREFVSWLRGRGALPTPSD